MVRDQGTISFEHHSWFISRGLIGEHVGVCPPAEQAVYAVQFGIREFTRLALRRQSDVSPMSPHSWYRSLRSGHCVGMTMWLGRARR